MRCASPLVGAHKGLEPLTKTTGAFEMAVAYQGFLRGMGQVSERGFKYQRHVPVSKSGPPVCILGRASIRPKPPLVWLALSDLA